MTLRATLTLSLLLSSVPWHTILAQPAAREAVRVNTVALQDIVIHPTVSAPAKVSSLSDSVLAAELNAVIKRIPVRVGDTVTTGSVLIEMDCSDMQLQATELHARMAATDARLVFAKQRLARAEALQQRNTLSVEELEQRRSDATSLDAEHRAQEAMLAINSRQQEKCTLRAPFNAVVLERKVSIGEYVAPGSPLLHVLDTENLEVSSTVLVGDTDSLKATDGIAFHYAGLAYPLSLRVLVGVIDSATRTREARLDFVNPASIDDQRPAPLPGASGRIIWRQPPALPADILVRRDGNLGVLIAEEDRARFHPLPNAEEGRPAPIDLPEWTRIITAGRLGIDAGDLLEITD